MMAYIKLEDAIEVCNKYKTLHKKENSRLGMGIVNDIYLDIDNLPTADVVEVKHGRWFDTDSFDHHYTPIYQCSVCRKEVADNYIDLHKYCLHCGAKMDRLTMP